MFSSGTTSTLSSIFRLAMGNIQLMTILALFSQSKMSQFNFGGFESAIYTLIKELADSDDHNHKILGLKSGKIERLSDLQTH